MIRNEPVRMIEPEVNPRQQIYEAFDRNVNTREEKHDAAPDEGKDVELDEGKDVELDEGKDSDYNDERFSLLANQLEQQNQLILRLIENQSRTSDKFVDNKVTEKEEDINYDNVLDVVKDIKAKNARYEKAISVLLKENDDLKKGLGETKQTFNDTQFKRDVEQFQTVVEEVDAELAEEGINNFLGYGQYIVKNRVQELARQGNIKKANAILYDPESWKRIVREEYEKAFGVRKRDRLEQNQLIPNAGGGRRGNDDDDDVVNSFQAYLKNRGL